MNWKREKMNEIILYLFTYIIIIIIIQIKFVYYL